MNEDKLERDRNRGAQAEHLLRSELLQEAFKVLEDKYLQTLLQTELEQKDQRDRLYLAVNVLRDVRNQLVAYFQSGRVAQVQIDRLADLQKRKK